MAFARSAAARSAWSVTSSVVRTPIPSHDRPTLTAALRFAARRRSHAKIIGVTSPERLKTIPDVPTLKEKGINYVRFGWLGLCAATGTPRPIIDQLNRDIASIVATPGYRAMIEGAGSIAISSTPAELARVITQTLDDVAASIQEFGMQQEQ